MDYGQQWYEAAIRRFYMHRGTPYPCTQEEIDFHYWSSFPKPNVGHLMPAIEATQEMMWQNDERRGLPTAEEISVSNLVKEVFSTSCGCGYGPDLAIKAFKDLATVFFGGRLHGNVYVMWADQSTCQKFHIANTFWGVCQRPRQYEREQVRILLNTDSIFRQKLSDAERSPLERMFSVLLHEVRHPNSKKSLLQLDIC